MMATTWTTLVILLVSWTHLVDGFVSIEPCIRRRLGGATNRGASLDGNHDDLDGKHSSNSRSNSKKKMKDHDQSSIWYPHDGIKPNPNFRTDAPRMDSAGYASSIWRNVRKRQPRLWVHALRTYQRMRVTQRKSIHHEGALLACAKLGLWKHALGIYKCIEDCEDRSEATITQSMVFSLVKACVRGCKNMDKKETTVEERKIPLDVAVRVLGTIEYRHSLPVSKLYLNPIASAYQSMGLYEESERVLGNPNGDMGTYSLLIRGAVASGDWTQAVDTLRQMTWAGLYPQERHVHEWVGGGTSSGGGGPRKKSWKKIRDATWLDGL